MRAPLRLTLTALAVVVLAVAAIGVASAAGLRGGTSAPALAAAPTGAPERSDDGHGKGSGIERFRANHPGIAGRLKHLGKRAEHFVHAEVTMTDKDGKLVHLQGDHGTVTAIG